MCWSALNVVKETMTLLSLTTHPACGPVAPEWVGCTFQSTDDAPKMRQVTFSHGFWRGSLTEKSWGSKSKWVSLISTHKLCTVLGEVKGTCYYTVIGRRGAPISLSQCCKELLMCVKFLDAQRQALVLKLETCVQSTQLPLNVFYFQERRKSLPFSAILSVLSILWTRM